MICPYQQLAVCRGKILISIGVLLALAILQLSRLEIDNSSSVFIPDSGENFRIASRILAKAPAAGLLYVGIVGNDAPAAAANIRRAVPSELATPIDIDFSGMSPDKMVRTFPFYFTPAMEKKLRHRIEVELPALMAENLRAMQSFGAIAGMGWIRGDPLGLRHLLREELPHHLPNMGGVKNGDTQFLLLFRPSSSSFDAAAARQLVQTIRAAVPSSCRLYLSGAPAHAAANGEAVSRDLTRIIIVSFLGIALAYIFLARSWGALWIVAIAGISTVFAGAFVSAAWPAASGLAIGFGASLMGLAEDYAVHMHFGLRSGNDQGAIYCSLLSPLLQGFLLNISGFCVLLLSSVPVIRQMALFACVSLSTGFLLAAVTAPFLPGFTFPRNIPKAIRRGRRCPSLGRGVAFLGFMLLSCFLLCCKMDVNFSPRLLGAKAVELANNTEKIKELWGIGTGTRFVVEGLSADEALAKAKSLAEDLRTANATGVLSPSDFFMDSASERDNVQRWQTWLLTSDMRRLLGNAAEKVGISREAFIPFYDAIAQAPERMRTPADLLRFDATAIVLCTDSSPAIPPREGVYIFSLEQLEEEIAVSFKKGQSIIGGAILAICFLVWLLIRSPGRVIAVLVPPLFSIMVVFLAFIVFHMPFTMAAACAIPIVFGLSLDHGIMITHALESGEALGVRKAIILASVTAFFSIGLLALSEHPALRTLGMTIFSGLAGELAAALWLVPFIYPSRN